MFWARAALTHSNFCLRRASTVRVAMKASVLLSSQLSDPTIQGAPTHGGGASPPAPGSASQPAVSWKDDKDPKHIWWPWELGSLPKAGATAWPGRRDLCVATWNSGYQGHWGANKWNKVVDGMRPLMSCHPFRVAGVSPPTQKTVVAVFHQDHGLHETGPTENHWDKRLAADLDDPYAWKFDMAQAYNAQYVHQRLQAPPGGSMKLIRAVGDLQMAGARIPSNKAKWRTIAVSDLVFREGAQGAGNPASGATPVRFVNVHNVSGGKKLKDTENNHETSQPIIAATVDTTLTWLTGCPHPNAVGFGDFNCANLAQEVRNSEARLGITPNTFRVSEEAGQKTGSAVIYPGWLEPKPGPGQNATAHGVLGHDMTGHGDGHQALVCTFSLRVPQAPVRRSPAPPVPKRTPPAPPGQPPPAKRSCFEAPPVGVPEPPAVKSVGSAVPPPPADPAATATSDAPLPQEDEDFQTLVRQARTGLDRMFVGEDFASSLGARAATLQSAGNPATPSVASVVASVKSDGDAQMFEAGVQPVLAIQDQALRDAALHLSSVPGAHVAAALPPAAFAKRAAEPSGGAPEPAAKVPRTYAVDVSDAEEVDDEESDHPPPSASGAEGIEAAERASGNWTFRNETNPWPHPGSGDGSDAVSNAAFAQWQAEFQKTEDGKAMTSKCWPKQCKSSQFIVMKFALLLQVRRDALALPPGEPDRHLDMGWDILEKCEAKLKEIFDQTPEELEKADADQRKVQHRLHASAAGALEPGGPKEARPQQKSKSRFNSFLNKLFGIMVPERPSSVTLIDASGSVAEPRVLSASPFLGGHKVAQHVLKRGRCDLQYFERLVREAELLAEHRRVEQERLNALGVIRGMHDAFTGGQDKKATLAKAKGKFNRALRVAHCLGIGDEVAKESTYLEHPAVGIRQFASGGASAPAGIRSRVGGCSSCGSSGGRGGGCGGGSGGGGGCGGGSGSDSGVGGALAVVRRQLLSR